MGNSDDKDQVLEMQKEGLAQTAGKPQPGAESVVKGEPQRPSKVEIRVTEIIVDQLGVQADEVKPEASFVDDLGADSLDTVELVMAFEEEFKIEIPDEDAEKIQKVKDAVSYIEAHVKQA